MASNRVVTEPSGSSELIIAQAGQGEIALASSQILVHGTYQHVGSDLRVTGPDGDQILIVGYFDSADPPRLVAPDGQSLDGELVAKLAGPLAPAQYAQAATAAGQPIGEVVTLEGTAQVTRATGEVVELGIGDPVFANDIVETGDAGRIGISFLDETILTVNAGSRMVLDELVYDPADASGGSMLLSLVSGSFAFISGEVAPSGNMVMRTPVATLGIRGTAGTAELLGNAIQVFTLPDPTNDNAVSAIEVYDQFNNLLGVATSASVFVAVDVNGNLVQTFITPDQQEAIDAIYDFLVTTAEAAGIDVTQAIEGGQSRTRVVDFAVSDGGGGPATFADGEGTFVGDVAEIGEIGPGETGSDTQFLSEAAIPALVIATSDVIDLEGNTGAGTPDAPIELIDQTTVSGGAGEPPTYVAGSATVAVAAGSAPGVDVGMVDLNPATGTLTYNPDTFDFLAGDEVAIYEVSYQVAVGAQIVDQSFLVTVDGINDAPVIAVEPGDADSGGLSEPDDSVSGTLTVRDVDTSDEVTAEVVSVVEGGTGPAGPRPDNATLLAMLTLGAGLVIDGASTSGSIAWTFDSDPEAFDYLADGETLVLSYTVRASDGTESDDQTVEITITGTNDKPDITVGAGDADSAALDETDGGLNAAGTLTVSDVDLTDTVDATVVSVAEGGTGPAGPRPDNATLLAMLSLDAGPVIDGASTTGSIAWTFASGAEHFSYLGADETLILTYTVRASDGTESDDQTVTITITGTGDGPDITVEAGDSDQAALDETDASLNAAGTLTVSDVDLTDTVDATVVSVAEGGTGPAGPRPDNATLLAMLTLGANPVIDGASTTRSIAWTFASGAESFSYLGADETLILTYTVRASDGTESDDQTVEITITGTNDKPDITVEAGDADQAALDETDAGLNAAGTLTVSDLDLTDEVTAEVVSVAEGGTGPAGPRPDNATLLAMLSLGANPAIADTATAGSIAWTFNSGGEAFNYLAAGETLVLTYTVRASDGAESDDQTVEITITGVNDDPDITGDFAGSVTEDSVLQSAGKLDVTDPDAGQSAFVPDEQVGTFGTFAIDADGNWTYLLNNASLAVQNLNDDDHPIESFTVETVDGAERTIDVTVHGDDEEPLIAPLPTTRAQLNDSVDLDNAGEAATFTKDVPSTTTGVAQLQLLLNGDYSALPNDPAHGFEGVTITFDGTELGTFRNTNFTVGDGITGVNVSDDVTAITGGVLQFNDPNDLVWNLGLSISQELWQAAVADGEVMITIDNTTQVDFQLGGDDFYGFRLVYNGGENDPIVFDLDGDGVGFSADFVSFDFDGDGGAERIGWASGGDGILAIDLDGDGMINDGTEIVSPHMVEGATSSLEALASFDSNHDGVIDALDERFAELSIWRDADEDAVTDAGELSSLGDVGIASISLAADPSGVVDANANIISAEGTYILEDGSDGTYAETMFAEVADATVVASTGDGGETAGENRLYGEAGESDTYLVDDAEAGYTIVGFESDRDAVDIGSLLDDSFVADNIDDYVATRQVGEGAETSTIISVDADGAANGQNFTDVATLEGVGGGDRIAVACDDQGNTTTVTA